MKNISTLIRYGIHAEQIEADQPELIEKVATDILTFAGLDTIERFFNLPFLAFTPEQRYELLRGRLVERIKNELLYYGGRI
jgi:hypothetical protein